MHVHGFPNMFILGHTQGGFTVNYPHLLDEASRHMAFIVRHALDHGVRHMEATVAAEAEWQATLAASSRNVLAFQEQCTPGYYNNEGRPAAGGFIGASYGNGPMPFFQLMEDWRRQGAFAGLDLRT